MERPSGHSNTNLDLVHYGPQSPGANLSGESGHAGTTAAKSASPGITLLKGRTAGVQRLAVKICDNHALLASSLYFQVGNHPTGSRSSTSVVLVYLAGCPDW